jgi:hypothetical protein
MSDRRARLVGEAQDARGELATSIVALREGLRPARIFAHARDAAVESAKPLVGKLTDEARRGGAMVPLLMIGVALARRRAAASTAKATIDPLRDGPTPGSGLHREESGRPRKGTGFLLAAGVAVGALAGLKLSLSPAERNVYRSAANKFTGVAASAVDRHYDQLARDRSGGASLVKLAAVALLHLYGRRARD